MAAIAPSKPLLSFCLILALGAVCAVHGQAPLANVQGEYVNFETPLIRPLLVTADGAHVLAINEADNRISVLAADTLDLITEIRAGQGLTALAERPGGSEIWASAMHSAAVLVIDTATWRVTHSLVAPAGVPIGLGDAAAPGGIAFSADGSKAWVAATATDALVVWDAETKTHLKTVPVAVTHNGRTTRLKEPRHVVLMGDTVYVSVYKSGNQTAAGPMSKVGLYPSILDLTRFPKISLPDVDIVGLSATDESLVFEQKAIGNLIFGLEAHPSSGELLVASLDGQNVEFLGEGAFPQGRVATNHLTFVAPGEAPVDYLRVELDDLGGGSQHLAMPTGLAVDAQGRTYVAGFASSNIGVFDTGGAFLGEIVSDLGPRGLAVSPTGETLYSLNRIAGTVSSYDVSGDLPTGALTTIPIGLYDPTFDSIRTGRQLYNDAANSGSGSAGCFSCHPDLQQDGLAWDLSAYHDQGEGFSPDFPPSFWKDRKFSMTTQDMRSLEDVQPYHWRGEMKDVDGFNGAFEGLLKGAALSDSDFAAVKDYTFSTVYPPNPFQQIDRLLSVEAADGLDTFNFQFEGDNSCDDCHTLPTGSRGIIVGPFVTGLEVIAKDGMRSVDTTHLRGLWTKGSDSADLAEGANEVLAPVTGFGFDHTGSHASVAEFIDLQFGTLIPDPLQRDNLKQFLVEIDSGLAPATNFAGMLDAETVLGFPDTYLTDQAAALNCDLVAFGRIDTGQGWVDVGLLFDRDLAAFTADDSGQAALTMAELLDMATQGTAELLFLGVPVWSGERIGVDRDRDGIFDADELAMGTDPADPDSDGDGFWDSYDDNPLVFDTEVTTTDAPAVLNVQVQLVTASVIKLTYETDTFSPTRVIYGETDQYGQEVGDAFPLPAGSNHWRRHHSIALRSLNDGVDVHFQIQTLGQNGVEGAGVDTIATTLDDGTINVAHTEHVADITADIVDQGASLLITVTVTVEDNKRVPVEGAEIHGVWTHFSAGDPIAQFDGSGGLTDASGIGTVILDIPWSKVEPGDEVNFTIPMYVGPSGAEIPGIVDTLVLDRPFAWPDSLATSVTVVVP